MNIMDILRLGLMFVVGLGSGWVLRGRTGWFSAMRLIRDRKQIDIDRLISIDSHTDELYHDAIWVCKMVILIELVIMGCICCVVWTVDTIEFSMGL